MIFDHIAIGGGVIGFNTTKSIIDRIISNKRITKKKFNFAIIDKNINNIIGGIAYNPELSTYGYFNNPVRLSPMSFVKYINNNKNFKKQLIDHLKNNTYDAIIITVAHKVFKELGSAKIKALGKQNFIIYDTKSLLPRDDVDGRL